MRIGASTQTGRPSAARSWPTAMMIVFSRKPNRKAKKEGGVIVPVVDQSVGHLERRVEDQPGGGEDEGRPDQKGPAGEALSQPVARRRNGPRHQARSAATSKV
jgi:hypothetical protein